MAQPMILEHIEQESIPDRLDPREYGFYKKLLEIPPESAVGKALFASTEASSTPRERTLNSQLVNEINSASPGELVNLSNGYLAEALEWDPAAVTRVSQRLDGVTLVRINDVSENGKRIVPLEPVLKNFASRVLHTRPTHVTDPVLTMMDFIGTNYHREEPLYENGITLPLIEQIYDRIGISQRVFPEVREAGSSGYYEIVVQSKDVEEEDIWEEIRRQCAKYGNMLASLAISESDEDEWRCITNEVKPRSCSCFGDCSHYSVYIIEV